jgi:hypothetical protein
MDVMSDSELSPASVAAKLQIPEGTFVLTYEKLDSEAILRSVQDDTAGAIAAFIGTTRNSFQGTSHNSSVRPVLFMRVFLGRSRSGCYAFGIPSVQQTGGKDDGGYIFIRSRKRDSV